MLRRRLNKANRLPIVFHESPVTDHESRGLRRWFRLIRPGQKFRKTLLETGMRGHEGNRSICRHKPLNLFDGIRLHAFDESGIEFIEKFTNVRAGLGWIVHEFVYLLPDELQGHLHALRAGGGRCSW